MYTEHIRRNTRIGDLATQNKMTFDGKFELLQTKCSKELATLGKSIKEIVQNLALNEIFN